MSDFTQTMNCEETFGGAQENLVILYFMVANNEFSEDELDAEVVSVKIACPFIQEPNYYLYVFL